MKWTLSILKRNGEDPDPHKYFYFVMKDLVVKAVKPSVTPPKL